MKSWEGTGAAYAASYASLCAGTIEALGLALGPPAGRSLLDVGAGTGDLVGGFSARGWRATGCEPEATMRGIARRAHPSQTFVSGSLPRLPFDSGSFDVVTANFVLNHVDDPRASARELARVAVSGGDIAATVWVSSPSWFWREVSARASVESPPSAQLPADLDFERSSPGFAAMLDEAGWQDVVATDLSWTWRVPSSALWASARGGVAAGGAMYRALDEDGRRRFRSAFAAVSAEHEVDGLLALAHTAAVAVGRAP